MQGTIEKLTFNPFQENTYVIHNKKGEGIIIDPGCHNTRENQLLQTFISKNEIQPKWLINTHTHLDHILGNAYVHDTYGLVPHAHPKSRSTFNLAEKSAEMWGIPYTPSPIPKWDLEEGQSIQIEGINLEIVFVPGHEPGHICLINREEEYIIGGDVLFRGSIGRTDLPGGDFDTLANSIRTKIYSLPDTFTVYSGHGPETTIGIEKQSNPFVSGN